MSKKLFIPLIIFVVLFALGVGVYIASNQAAQPSTTTPIENAPHTLTITEINRTLTTPNELGTVTYTTNGPAQILLFSTTYEKLNGCASKPIAELQLSDTQKTPHIAVSGQYKFAHFIVQPQGACGGSDGNILADATSRMILTAQ